MQMRNYRTTWHYYKWNSGIKYHLSRQYILHEIKFPLVGPIEAISSQPYHNYVFNNFRFYQYCRCNICYTAYRNNIKWIIGTAGQSFFYQVQCCIATMW